MVMFKGMMALTPGNAIFYVKVPQKYQTAYQRAVDSFVEFSMTDSNNMITDQEKILEKMRELQKKGK
jgi:hypothetical protein